MEDFSDFNNKGTVNKNIVLNITDVFLFVNIYMENISQELQSYLLEH